MEIRSSLLFIVLLHFCPFACSVHGLDRKTKYLRRVAAKEPLVPVSAAQLVNLVTAGPRSYALVLLLTQNGGGCRPCRVLTQKVQSVASAFERVRYTNESSGQCPAHNVFFVVFNVVGAKDTKLFRSMGFKTIPHLVWVPPSPTKRDLSGGLSKELWRELLHERFAVDSTTTTASIVAQAVRHMKKSQLPTASLLGISIAPRQQTVSVSALAMGVLALGVGVYILVAVGDHIYTEYLSNPMFYLFVGMTVFVFCISGGMFNYVRNTPLLGAGRQPGQTMFVYPRSGTQFAIETHFVAILTAACAGSVIVLNTKVLRGQMDTKKRRITVLVCLGIFHMAFRQIRYLYSLKNQSYHMGGMWG